MPKVDNFETFILRYPQAIQDILRDLDNKVWKFPQKASESIQIRRYTTGVPDIRYQVEVSGRYKPVFSRVRPRNDKVRIKIETVRDPLGRTEPREKSGRWKKSPRSDRKFALTKRPDLADEELLFNSMLSSMRGKGSSK